MNVVEDWLIRCLRGSVASIITLLFVSCASTTPKDIRVPSGQSTPIDDYSVIWHEASESCRGVSRLEFLGSFRGRVGDRTLRRTRLRAATAKPGALRLEGLAPFGAPAFVLVARPEEAVLLLPRERQFIQNESARDILHALTGLALEPDEIRPLLTGCVVPEGEAISGRSYGNRWVSIGLSGDANVYVENVNTEWLIVFGTHRNLVVEYSGHVNGLPRSVRVQAGADPDRADLTVDLAQVRVNTQFDPEVFLPVVPDDFGPVTLDELRSQPPTDDRAARLR